MFGIIALSLAGAAAAVVGYAATRPDEFRVTRSETIDAPPEKLYALIADFYQWPSWSPWEKLDPAMTRTHSGPESGLGAVYSWKGNKKVGSGRMEITGASPARSVTIKLDFLEPWEANNTTEFVLEPAGGGTRVTWSMLGKSPFFFKLMGLFMSMDKMVGKDFEKGLAQMKELATRA